MREVFAAVHREFEELWYFAPASSLVVAIFDNSKDCGGGTMMPLDVLENLYWYRVRKEFYDDYDGSTPDYLWWISFGAASRKIPPPDVKIATVRAQELRLQHAPPLKFPAEIS